MNRTITQQASPELSVILPMQDSRGQAEACVRRLVHEQTLERDRYEIVLVAPNLEPSAEATARELVSPRDRIVACDSANEATMNNAGAASARAPILWFTEAHCLPEPTALEEALKFLSDGDY